MFSVNVATLAGRLGGDPEIKELAGGRRLATFSLAVDRNFKNAAGKWVTETDWIRVVAFLPHLVEMIEKSGRKGVPALVIGSLRAHEWTKEDGEKARMTELEITGEGGVCFPAAPMTVNDVNLVGRLGDNAAIRTLTGADGGKMATMSVAVGRPHKDGDGKRPTDWLRVVCFSATALNTDFAKNATKGRVVLVRGSFRAREYADKTTGEIKTSHEIVVETSGDLKAVNA